VPIHLTLLSGIGLGAGAALLLDPSRGARRRALVRDKLVHGLHKAGDAIGATSRDLQNRVQGAMAVAESTVLPSPVSDEVLVGRVRSRMGRVVSHPRAIDIRAHDGAVTLAGHILSHEKDPLITQVLRTPGVDHVEDRLAAHDEPGSIPDLQGGGARTGEQPVLLQRSWPPAVRLGACAAGVGLISYGIARRDSVGAGLALAGLALAARGLVNIEFSRLVGVGAGRRAVDIQKTIDIKAPVGRVFELWRDYENFPAFMTHIREIRPTAVPGQSHWTVNGPGALPVEFDTVVTEFIPDELIAWKTVEGSSVQHAGLIRFQPNRDGSTRVHIRMSYNPPGGAVGHAVAALVGADARARLDDDLLRFKTFIETGRPPHDAAESPPAETHY
jgi:uncharacterized membrane protein